MEVTQSNQLTVEKILRRIEHLQEHWEARQSEQASFNGQLRCGARVLVLQQLHVWILEELIKDATDPSNWEITVE